MSEAMWVWDYELKTLGSWPSTGYNGHNTPVEVVTQMDVKTLRDERDRLALDLKKRIWLLHGSRMNHLLYGDDGRMDCNVCFREYAGATLEQCYEWEIADACALVAKAALTPAGQRWTTRKPTEPGLWWWRQNRQVKSPWVVEIDSELNVWFHGKECESTIESLTGEWQGPLTPNEETE